MVDFKDKLADNPVFNIIAACAKEMDLPSFVIGGYVRDLLLRRNSKDIDIVCLGSGIGLAECVSGKIPGKISVSVFNNFGTAMLQYNGMEIEFVGARKESYNRESRKPSIENGSLEDDQNRRDFTINAMAIQLTGGNYGNLIDPFDGIGDLKRKLIKTPLNPEVTFSDDPLRMMRAIRFASQLGFDIDPDTFHAIIKNKDRLAIVSMERITEEMNKIILSDKPSYGFKLLYQCGLLEIIFPELVALQGVETIDNKSHKDNFYHTIQVLDNVARESEDLWLRWAALLHDIAKPATKRFDKRVGWTFHGHEDKGARMVPGIFRRMKLPLNEKMKSVANLVKLHLRPIALVKENITDAAIRRLIVESGEDYEALMILCKADVTSKNDVKVKKYLENFEAVKRKVIEVEEKDHLRNFQPVITGEDIMSIFDIKPSKLVGELKSDLREAILEGNVNNVYDEALLFLKKLARDKYNL